MIFRLSMTLSCLASFIVVACVAPLRTPKAPEYPGGFAQLQESEASAQDEWWKSFGDPSLEELIRSALRDNFSLRAVWDRLAQAEAQAQVDGVDLLPRVDGRAGVNLSRSRSNGLSSGSQRFNLGLFASYELDLWGRLRANAKSAELDVEVSANEVRAAAVSLSAEIALRHFEGVAAQQEIALLREQIASNEAVLEILNTLFDNGNARAADILRQENLIERARGDLALLERTRDVSATQVLLLSSQDPRDRDSLSEIARLPEMSELPSLASVAELIDRRPDLQAAILRVSAQDQSLAAALANRYPQISLSAGIETSGRASDLLDNWLANLIGNLVQPLFDAGERESVIERERARLSELLNNYSAAVLGAIQEVESALIAESALQRYRSSLDAQIARAERIFNALRESYLNQQSEYIDVLNAQASLQSLQRERVRTQRDLVSARIALYRALVGAPELERPNPRHDELRDESTNEEATSQ